ncbi:MAG: hypothetical protein JWO05_3698 [Gemmatimonadetes bacterium]|nr:hypothetical protein [Gemmatimonadota bacterium]
MKAHRIVIIGALAALVAAHLAHAQAPAQASAAKAAATDTTARLAGTWQGTYSMPNGPSGALKLVIAKDSALSITQFAAEMDGSMQEMTTSKFAITTTEISWSQELMGQVCGTTAVLKGAELRGVMLCGHGAVSFVMTKP